MLKIGLNVQKDYPKFTVETKNDIIYPNCVPLSEAVKGDIVILNNEIQRCKKDRQRYYLTCSLTPESLETNIKKVLCRQRHLHWLLCLFYHEYETYSFNAPEKRDFMGLGAILHRWG